MFKEYDIQYRYASSLDEEVSAYDPDNTDPEENDTKPAEGYLKVFDVKVELRPVELAPLKASPAITKN